VREETPEGFVVPFHQSLLTPVLIGGAPRRLAILNGTMTAAIGLGLHQLWALPLGILVHMLAVLAAKQDPQFFEVLLEHLKTKSFYHAGR
jgi:type IV secretion system protein TrbD